LNVLFDNVFAHETSVTASRENAGKASVQRTALELSFIRRK